MVKKATATTPYQKNSTPQTGDVDQLAGDILDEIRGLAQISDKIERATESALKKIAFAERKIEATQNRVEKEIYQMQKTTEKEIQREREQARKIIENEKAHGIKAIQKEKDQVLNALRKEFNIIYDQTQKKLNDLSRSILEELRKRGL